MTDASRRHLTPLRCRLGRHSHVVDKEETQTGPGLSGNPVMTTIWWHCARCGKRGMSTSGTVLKPY
jgi:hypothetical protein